MNIKVYLKAGEADAPSGGCVELTGNLTSGAAECIRPTSNASAKMLAVLSTALKAQQAGDAETSFAARALYTGTYDQTKRLGSTASSYLWGFYTGSGSALPGWDHGTISGSKYCSLFFSNSAGLTNFPNGTDINEATPATATGQIAGDKYAKISSAAGNESKILLPFVTDGQSPIGSGSTIEVFLEWSRTFAEVLKNPAAIMDNTITLTCGLIEVAFNPNTVTWNWWVANGAVTYAADVYTIKANAPQADLEAEASTENNAATIISMVASAASYGVIIKCESTQTGGPDAWSGFGRINQTDPTVTRYKVG